MHACIQDMSSCAIQADRACMSAICIKSNQTSTKQVVYLQRWEADKNHGARAKLVDEIPLSSLDAPPHAVHDVHAQHMQGALLRLQGQGVEAESSRLVWYWYLQHQEILNRPQDR